MAKTEKPKTEKKGRNNMASSRKDFDKVYADALKDESPEGAALVGKYLGILSTEMSGLGWKPKPVAIEPAQQPAEPVEPAA